MIFDLLNDLNKDCNFTNDIHESEYIEGNNKKSNLEKGKNEKNEKNEKNSFYPNFIKCILSEFDPLCSTINEKEKKMYISQKIMEICSFIDEKDEYFKNYNFHKSLKSRTIQQGLQLHDKNINHISSLYYLNEFYKRHFVIVHENIAYPTCIKNYPKIYLSINNHKVKVLNGGDYPQMNLKNLFEKSKIVDNVKRDIKGIYNLHLEAISKYKLDDLKKIALECKIDLKNSGKNKIKSILYDEINLYKLNN